MPRSYSREAGLLAPAALQTPGEGCGGRGAGPQTPLALWSSPHHAGSQARPRAAGLRAAAGGPWSPGCKRRAGQGENKMRDRPWHRVGTLGRRCGRGQTPGPALGEGASAWRTWWRTHWGGGVSAPGRGGVSWGRPPVPGLPPAAGPSDMAAGPVGTTVVFHSLVSFQPPLPCAAWSLDFLCGVRDWLWGVAAW